MATRKPVLERMIHGHSDYVTGIYYVEEKDVFITTSEDTTLRIWQKRENGDFWPCVWRTFDSGATCLWFEIETRSLYVGLHSGDIIHLVANEEYDALTLKTNYTAHKNRVTSIIHSQKDGFLMSCSRDKVFQLHSTKTNSPIDRFTAPSWITCLEYDNDTQFGFAGTYNGDVVVLKCTNSGVKLLQVLTAHAENVTCLAWDSLNQRLFSGGADNRVVIWDFGTKQGLSYELNKHTAPVRSLIFLSQTDELLSLGDDNTLYTWDLGARRISAQDWDKSDTCQICGVAFFWAFKISFNTNRQHHCRKCGRAVCASCSPNKAPYPIAGFENPEILCKECFPSLTPEERASSCSGTPLVGMTVAKYDPISKRLLGANKDYSFRYYSMEL